MTITIALVAAALLAIVLALLFTRRGRAQAPSLPAPATWAQSAGEEFASLGDSERCDLVFALAAVDDEPSRSLLERALGDPSDAVCLAAARALAKIGRSEAVERYFRAHPGDRARRITRTLELFA